MGSRGGDRVGDNPGGTVRDSHHPPSTLWPGAVTCLLLYQLHGSDPQPCDVGVTTSIFFTTKIIFYKSDLFFPRIENFL